MATSTSTPLIVNIDPSDAVLYWCERLAAAIRQPGFPTENEASDIRTAGASAA